MRTEMTNETFLAMMDAKQPFNEEQLRQMAHGYVGELIETQEGDRGRWDVLQSTIFEVDGRRFCIDWYEGLTDCQPNEFPDQPYEVVEHVYQKMMDVREWIPLAKARKEGA